MKLRTVRSTALRAEPSAAAAIVGELSPNVVLDFAGEKSGPWIKVAVAPSGATTLEGWVLASDCEAVPDHLAASPLAELLAKRQRANVVSVGNPPRAQPHAEPEQQPGAGASDDEIDFSPDEFAPGPRSPKKSSLRSNELFGVDADFGGNAADAGFERPPPRRRAARKSVSRKSKRSKKPTPAAKRTASDVVDISVFGPEAVRAGGDCLVQVFLHALDQRTAAAALAREFDPETRRRALKTLASEVARGQRVQVIFDVRGLTVDEPMQELVWRGEPTACQFTVSVPQEAGDDTFHPRVIVLVDSKPIGTVTFALRATAAGRPGTAASDLRGERARRYSYAFLSYASPDRAEVIKRAQGLQAVGIAFFQDLLSLEPGDRWEQRLYREIDRCDVFLLFWSSHAKVSPWVLKEAEYALARQKASGDAVPDIMPVIIEVPTPLPPPAPLRDIHFNDRLACVLAGLEAQRPAARPRP